MLPWSFRSATGPLQLFVTGFPVEIWLERESGSRARRDQMAARAPTVGFSAATVTGASLTAGRDWVGAAIEREQVKTGPAGSRNFRFMRLSKCRGSRAPAVWGLTLAIDFTVANSVKRSWPG